MSAEKADPFASLKAANRERAAALSAPPEDEPEEELMPTFKVTLPPLTVGGRWELAQFLDETAVRTVSHPDSNRAADWERALVGVLTDLAAAAREAQGQKVASAAEAVTAVSEVSVSASVSLNREARERLHRVLKVARKRAPDGPVGAAVVTISDQYERFVYGPKGEPAEPPRRGGEPPGLWEPMNITTSLLARFRR